LAETVRKHILTSCDLVLRSKSMIRACAVTVALAACDAARSKISQEMLETSDSEGPSLALDDVTCPVLASLVSSNTIKPNSEGFFNQTAITYGLMATGNSYYMAMYQSRGIAGFAPDDVHQKHRVKFAKDDDRWLNFWIHNVKDKCTGSERLPNGHFCNANVGYQQHGYSTMVRDPRGGPTAEARFRRWFGIPGVLTEMAGVNEKVWTADGFARLLKEAYQKGDKSGEFSNNKIGRFYHPSIPGAFKRNALSQWQAVTAWASFWVAFATRRNGVMCMTESELRSFFIDGKFPKDWKMQSWGFGETFRFIATMEGRGIGDQWIRTIKGVLKKFGRNNTEAVYLQGMGGSIVGLGGAIDDITMAMPTR